jgi:hypothetical protein
LAVKFRLNAEQIDALRKQLVETTLAGWGTYLDVMWDFREKIAMLERVSDNTATQHVFLFHQQRESKTLITYLLIAMQLELDEWDRKSTNKDNG